ncbi:MAG TPA: Ig-like domain-containing protein, partial [Verrucomicrobiae bacterium]|jgi:hypothetical protein
MDPDGAVTNVAFYVNGIKLTDDTVPPYATAWNVSSTGTYLLFAVASDADGLSGTSSVVKITVTNAPPRISRRLPGPGFVTTLEQLTVTFTKPVQGVDAADLLINGVAATNVTGSVSNYTFRFAPPLPGLVNITWTADHGITDTVTPPAIFDATALGATWQYELMDPPRITGFQLLDGMVSIAWESRPAAHYRVESTSILPATNWSVIAEDVMATNSVTTLATIPGAEPKQFYRVVFSGD